jgi:diguanylate cyclase (GGDEF)-like protein
MLHLSTRAKLSISLSIILVLAFLAINISNYFTTRALLRQSLVHEALPGISNEIYHEIQRKLSVPVHAATLMANDTFLRDWLLEGERDVSRITKYLWEIKEKYGFFSAFLISSRTMKYYHYKGVHKIISPQDDHDVWYYQFIESGKDYELDVDTDEVTQGTLTIFINHRVNNYYNEMIGVTGVGLRMGEVGRLFNSYRHRYEKNVYLLDRHGTIQVHFDQSFIEKRNIFSMPGIRDIAERITTNTTHPTVASYKTDGRQMLLISRYVPEFDWFLVVEHEESEGLAGIRHNFYYNLAIGLIVTLLVIVIHILMVNHYQGRLEKMAATDELTGLANRRAFLVQARRVAAQAARYGEPISLLAVDIDHFKEVNDHHGHEAGDRVLKETARLIRLSVRENDYTGRMGGEEFCVILPRTDREEARLVAERLRMLVETNRLEWRGNPCTVTVSIGVATDENGAEGFKALSRAADRALYRAKQEGRNRVAVTQELAAPEV